MLNYYITKGKVILSAVGGLITNWKGYCSILTLKIKAWFDYLKDLLNGRLGKGSFFYLMRKRNSYS